MLVGVKVASLLAPIAYERDAERLADGIDIAQF
jgi:hypothetical protein